MNQNKGSLCSFQAIYVCIQRMMTRIVLDSKEWKYSHNYMIILTNAQFCHLDHLLNLKTIRSPLTLLT